MPLGTADRAVVDLRKPADVTFHVKRASAIPQNIGHSCGQGWSISQYRYMHKPPRWSDGKRQVAGPRQPSGPTSARPAADPDHPDVVTDLGSLAASPALGTGTSTYGGGPGPPRPLVLAALLVVMAGARVAKPSR
ncbi:MAG: hypothetical protein LC776_11325 [Acidobacteria bacterium]|nr:hypothetical protein [Acidobacteriota bacterium]